MSAVVRTCEWAACGKTFSAKSAEVKRGWARFCSKSCAAKPKAKRLDFNGYGLKDGGSERLFANAHQFSSDGDK